VNAWNQMKALQCGLLWEPDSLSNGRGERSCEEIGFVDVTSQLAIGATTVVLSADEATNLIHHHAKVP
jgi:hypothetical protein